MQKPISNDKHVKYVHVEMMNLASLAEFSRKPLHKANTSFRVVSLQSIDDVKYTSSWFIQNRNT